MSKLDLEEIKKLKEKKEKALKRHKVITKRNEKD